MKKILVVSVLIFALILTGCDIVNTRLNGGKSEDDNIRKTFDVDRIFAENYINELTLPVLDIHFERQYVSDDRMLIMDDSIENELEYLVYEFYLKTISGDYEDVYELIGDERFKNAIINEEENFKEGIYLSKIIIDEIDLMDTDDIDEWLKQDVVEKRAEFAFDRFALIEVEKVIKHNEKSLSRAPQVGDGEVERYYLVGEKDKKFKIYDVYWG